MNKSYSLLTFLLFICLIINISGVNADTHKKTIAIDLDGVLDNYTGYNDEIPSMREGAKEFIEKLSENYELILFTTRPSKLAVIWLQNNKIDKYFKDVTNVKIPAYIYLDDRALRFNGDYDETLNEINNYKVHWKN